MDDALDNLLAAVPLLLVGGEPLTLVHPRGLPFRLPTPVTERTLAALIQALAEGWRVQGAESRSPGPRGLFLSVPRRRRRRRR